MGRVGLPELFVLTSLSPAVNHQLLAQFLSLLENQHTTDLTNNNTEKTTT
jgi:hypothetical protein